MGNLLLAFLAGHRVLAVLVACEFFVELFLGELLPPLFLGSEFLGDGEKGHDGVVVEAVDFHLVQNLQRVAQGFGHIAENIVHLLLGLEPLLLGIEHAVGVVQILLGREAEQVVVCLGVLLIYEVGVVGADELDAILVGELDEHLVGFLLQGECLSIGADGRVGHLMALQLQVVVVAEHTVVPFDGLSRTGDIAL